METDSALQLIAALPDAVKRQVYSHVTTEGVPLAQVPHEEARNTLKLCVRDHFLPKEACEAARQEAERLLDASGRQAGFAGAAAQAFCNLAFRGDRTCWIKPDQTEWPALRTATDAVLALQRELKAEGYDVNGRPSIQLSCYPGKGASYARHADASGTAPDRTLTAIVYLNHGWDASAQGGQLCVYNVSEREGPGYLLGEPATVIAPLGGRFVVFDSRLHHEVLASHKPRYALTVWFKREAAAAPVTESAARRSALTQEAQLCPQPARSPAEQIFVSIAAFRDAEARWTVRDLLQKASRPGRVRVGIVWQVDAASEAELMELPIPASQRSQVREVQLDYREATGPCKARVLAQALWAGEAFVLQLDAHMRFAPGWDASLVKWLCQAEAAHPGTKPVLSTYPPGFEGLGPDAKVPLDDRPTLLRASHFGPDGMLRLKGSRLARAADTPIPSLFWAAGFSFSRSALLTEVPYQDLPFLFFGEEQAMLARIWTAGFDLYTPPRSVVWHLWSRAYRPTFHSCVPQDAKAKLESQRRVLELFCLAQHDNNSSGQTGQQEKTHADLGTARTLTAFQETIGVSYSSKHISTLALRGCRDQHLEFACKHDGKEPMSNLAVS